MLGYKVAECTVRRIIKNDLKLSYKSVRRINMRGNNESCLVKRHLYAKKMLQLLKDDYHIYNVDESWLSCSAFDKKRWVERGSSATLGDQVLK